MARKKSSKRRNTRFQAIPVNTQFSLGTLGSNILTSASITSLGVAKFFVVSADIIWSLSDKTAGEGPIEVGIANGDLSNTELGEAIDASPSSMADIVARERARRPVRRSGQFVSSTVSEVLNNGKPIRTKLRTMLDTGIELTAWARNGDGGALTTGCNVDVHGTIYGYWA